MFDTNLNEFYQYVFGSSAKTVIDKMVTNETLIKKKKDERQALIKEKFSFITDNQTLSKKFRSLLRHYGSESLEVHLYGNNTDELDNDPNAKIPSAEDLKQQFEKMNNLYGYFNENDLDSFTTLFKLSKLMCEFEIKNNDTANEMAYEYAYKLLVLFSLDDNKNQKQKNPFLSIEHYLKILKMEGSENPLHDALLTPIPSIKDVESFDLAAWRKLIKQEGEAAINVFARSADIAKNGNPTPSSIEEAREILGELTYKQADSDKELAALCIEYNISEKIFNQCLALKKLIKEKDTLPDLIINGIEYGQKGYYLLKLPIKDPRAFILGYITKCCQSVGGDSQQCVIDGISLANNGFYVLLKQKQGSKNKKNVSPKTPSNDINYEDFEILGQGYMWRDKDKNIVLDSWENKYTKENAVVTPLIRALGKQIVETYPETNRVTIGLGGKTPAALTENSVLPGEMLEGSQYDDSTTQALIYQDDSKIWPRLTPLIEPLKKYYGPTTARTNLDDYLTPQYIHSDRIITFLENIMLMDRELGTKVFRQFIQFLKISSPAYCNYVIWLGNNGLLNESNLALIEQRDMTYVNLLIFLKNENILSDDLLNLLQSKNWNFLSIQTMLEKLRLAGILNEKTTKMIFLVDELNPYPHLTDYTHITPLLIELINAKIDITDLIAIMLHTFYFESVQTVNRLKEANLLNTINLEALLSEKANFEKRCDLLIALNQCGISDTSFYFKISSNTFILYSNKFIPCLKELHRSGTVDKYLNHIVSLIANNRLYEIEVFINRLIVLHNNSVSTLMPEEVLKITDSDLHSLIRGNALNACSVSLLLQVPIDDDLLKITTLQGIIKLTRLNVFNDTDIQQLLTPDTVTSMNKILTLLHRVPDIEFSKKDVTTMLERSNEYFQFFCELNDNHLLSKKNIKYLLANDAKSFDDFIANKKDVEAQTTWVNLFWPLLGDNPDPAKPSLLTRYNIPNRIPMSSHARLEALDLVFSIIFKNVDPMGEPLYAQPKASGSTPSFLFKQRKMLISAKQKTHIDVLKSEYISILQEHPDDKDLLDLGRASKLVNFHTSNYEKSPNSLTGSRNKVEKLIATYEKKHPKPL